MPTNYITIYSIRSLTSCIVGLSLVKCCSLLLLCIALTGCSKKSTGPEPVPTMSILPAESEIAPDQVAQLQIVLSDMDVPIFAITFRIQSDSTILTAVAENGFLPGDYFTENSISFFRQEGSIFYFSLSKTSGPEETSSTGSIGILSVSSTGSGVFELTIIPEDIVFYDSSGSIIQVPDLLLESAMVTVQ